MLQPIDWQENSYFSYLLTSRTQRARKSTKEIGDMGFGGEELLLGGRLFPVTENP